MILPCLAMAVIDGVPQVAFPRRLAHGAESVLTQVAIRLWSLLGTWIDDTALGLDWIRLALPDVATVEIEALVRLQCGAVPGVLRILEVVATRTSVLTVSVRLEVTDGNGGVSVVGIGDPAQLDLWGGYVPGAWYTMVQIRHRPIMRPA